MSKSLRGNTLRGSVVGGVLGTILLAVGFLVISYHNHKEVVADQHHFSLRLIKDSLIKEFTRFDSLSHSLARVDKDAFQKTCHKFPVFLPGVLGGFRTNDKKQVTSFCKPLIDNTVDEILRLSDQLTDSTYLSENFWNYDAKKHIRVVTVKTDEMYLGYVVDIDRLLEFLNKYLVNEVEMFHIFNDQGRLLQFSDSLTFHRRLSTIQKTGKFSECFKKKSICDFRIDDSTITISKIFKEHLYIAIVSKKAAYFRDNASMFIMFILVVFFVVGVTTLVILLNERRLKKQLLAFLTRIRRIRNGDYSLRMDNYEYKELNVLSHCINDMVTVINEREQELGRRIDDEEHIKDELVAAKHNVDKANHAKELFLAHASHDMRTPLNVIIGLAENLDESNVSEFVEFKKRILKNGNKLLRLVEDLLDVSSANEGIINVYPKRIRSNEFFASLTAEVEKNYKETGVRIKTGTGIPEYLYWDDERVKQIFHSMAQEAAELDGDDKISILIETVSRHRGDEIRFQIKTGKVVLLDRERSIKMLLVEKIANLMNGTVEVLDSHHRRTYVMEIPVKIEL